MYVCFEDKASHLMVPASCPVMRREGEGVTEEAGHSTIREEEQLTWCTIPAEATTCTAASSAAHTMLRRLLHPHNRQSPSAPSQARPQWPHNKSLIIYANKVNDKGNMTTTFLSLNCFYVKVT